MSASRELTVSPMQERCARLAGGEQRFPPELLDTLHEFLRAGDTEARLLDWRPLSGNVYRLWAVVGDDARTLIVKASDPWMARRNRLVAEHWLPALGMQASGPPLLGCAGERDGERVWQVYEDLGDGILDEAAPEPERIRAATEQIARIHTRFAEEPLLAECRLWGSDFSIRFYSSNVRDALRSLVKLRAPELELSARHAAVRERLLRCVLALRDQEEMRAQSLADHGGPETLVHGDLWPKNVIVQSTADGLHVRLIDWDRVGVGSFTYDLSTFLSRFPAGDRMWILDSYRRAAERAGWHLPAPADLNVLFSTAELARLTNRVIWPAIAVSQGHTDRAWAFGELESIGDWIERDQPLLPV